jgi:hypothetical protein
MTDDPLDQPEEEAWKLAVPFVACASEGGPYEDDAFCAGFEAGRIAMALESAIMANADRVRWTVLKTLVKQLDLIAMNAGFVMTVAEAEVEDQPGHAFVAATFEASST